MTTNKRVLEDLNVIVSGQGGDGSLTVVNILADILRTYGLKVYTERDVLSRIKGGITAANLRAYNGDRLCISSQIDLLVAFDQLGVSKYAFRLNKKSIVIYDSSIHWNCKWILVWAFTSSYFLNWRIFYNSHIHSKTTH